jgi:deazaflavin-dependent oxidoreductase (nitroreductase family)
MISDRYPARGGLCKPAGMTMRRRVGALCGSAAALVFGALAVVWVHDMTDLVRRGATAGQGGDPSMVTSLSDRMAGVADRSTMRLTHYGRKSGRPYEVTIWFVVDGDTMYLTTMNRQRQWVRNVAQTPRVGVQIGPERFEGTVTPVSAQPTLHKVYDLLTRKYWVMWVLDWAGSLVGRNPRQDKMDLGRGGFFRLELNG